MKVGILTFHDAHNYGAVLQAYALKKYIQKLNYDVSVINYHHFSIPDGFPKRRNLKTSIVHFKDFLKEIRQLCYSHNDHIKRWNKFNKFIEQLKDGKQKVYRSEKELEKLDIDFWICGSDQIWNTDITNGINKGFFLDFKTHGKKISYAVSMGIPELPREYEEEFKRCLNQLDCISVREESLENYSRRFTNKSVTKVVDPTLLLNEEDYDELLGEKTKEKYLLIYALGPDERLTSIAKKIAETQNIKIIELNDNKKKNYHFEQLSDGGPNDFVTLIKNAQVVVTNSFHGTIFSIIFKKEFYTITRGNRNSRMENILDIVDMRDRLIENIEDIEKVHIQDYNRVLENLNKEVKKSKEFLKNALK